jgi:putative tributyrin esterase
MALIEAHWHSPTLQLKVSTNILVPDLGEGPFPVFYLLHGLSDDHTIWMRFTRLEVYARNLPLIIVMPQGFRSFYTSHHEGPDFAAYIARDLPNFIERHFRARSDRAGRCIGGLSMGGYGALRIGLGFPDRYVSANSHSGAFRLLPREGGPVSMNEFRNIFGPNPTDTLHDIRHLARLAQQRRELPRLLIDCGIEDHLIENNRALHADLDRLKVPHEYREFPGAHNWDYWDEHIREALAFHCQALNIQPY